MVEIPKHAYDSLEISTRTSVPLLLIRLFILQIIFIALYLAYLIVFDRFEAPLKSGGILVFFLWQFTQFFTAFYYLLKWFCLYYEITEKEVVLHKGVIFQERRYFSLDKVESVTVNQTLLGRILNYGTIHLILYYSDAPIDVAMINVPRPKRYERLLQQNLQDFGHREE
ncbi:MAG TPA: PH domain-containing protein [Candidatus Gracilibacteria bacterium]